ncbi:glycoside hydrolase family 140 protein [Chitinophagaceae bacterium LB-8]|uniref:Glycoside hydrolase family 140 protein n=1 Tax=Paraflavisolibacter caeni TaxID=2982496 RepID=A0A9X3B9E2_9BACT|nr:glycoside hydrolase family 140 protein [Paraflavisolibacter caeni]MCU7551900.1 glycoside hydrolase family 140 protein [Paraflavisolibacter caeni]
MLKKIAATILVCFLSSLSFSQTAIKPLPKLKVSANGRYLVTEKGEPFFWLGDTGWLLFGKLTREEAEKYLEDRRMKGFNVIQVMTLHTVSAVNVYGDKALNNRDVAAPITTPGNSFADAEQYDFWDHVDYIIKKAEEKGIYMALVPVWGTNVKEGYVNQQQAQKYASWLADRYKNQSNIIWMNGGDIPGADSLDVWKTIGSTLRAHDPNHLITFHPRGRTTSSIWFHKEPWLDFNMFQSGHRRYDQDTTAGEQFHYGEDNWKYIQTDFRLSPVKPSIDGEPSYERIPQGLHDTTEKLWTDADVRRYGYWSVFAGGFGYTYGHNAVMQMHKPTDKGSAYGSKDYWYDAIDHPGARQMLYLKNLMLSKPYLERVPDQSLIASGQGEKYNHLVATRGKNYAFIYTFNGRNMNIAMGKIKGSKVKASWYNPRNEEQTVIGTFANKGVQSFSPPGEQQDGNDWVLVLETI